MIALIWFFSLAALVFAFVSLSFAGSAISRVKKLEERMTHWEKDGNKN